MENPSSCHSASFKYSLAGDNPGQLTLKLQTEDGENDVRVLWATSTVTDGWTAVEVPFRYWDRFKVQFLHISAIFMLLYDINHY